MLHERRNDGVKGALAWGKGVGLGGVDGTEAQDPHPQVISVRQRRDYKVPSVAALLRLKQEKLELDRKLAGF